MITDYIDASNKVLENLMYSALISSFNGSNREFDHIENARVVYTTKKALEYDKLHKILTTDELLFYKNVIDEYYYLTEDYVKSYGSRGGSDTEGTIVQPDYYITKEEDPIYSREKAGLAKIDEENAFAEDQEFTKDIKVNGDVIESGSKLSDKYSGINHTHEYDSLLNKPTTITNEQIQNIANNTVYRNVGHIPLSQKGAIGGVATLDGAGLIPSTQLPSYIDDIRAFPTKADFPAIGEVGVIFLDQSELIQYRWVEASASYEEIIKGAVQTVFGRKNDIIAEVGDYSAFYTLKDDCGLVKVTEGGKTGYRRSDADPDSYGDIGNRAVDLSWSAGFSNFYGAKGDYSFTAGLNNTALTDYSIAMGSKCYSPGLSGVAIGTECIASEDYSTALGYHNQASEKYGLAIGRYCDLQSGYLFVIGNGEQLARKNILEVDKVGNVNVPLGAKYKVNGVAINGITANERTKLAGVEAGAQVNPDLSSYAKQDWVGENYVSDAYLVNTTGRVGLVTRKNGIQVVKDIPLVTHSSVGLMNSLDKTILDSVERGAQVNPNMALYAKLHGDVNEDFYGKNIYTYGDLGTSGIRIEGDKIWRELKGNKANLGLNNGNTILAKTDGTVQAKRLDLSSASNTEYVATIRNGGGDGKGLYIQTGNDQAANIPLLITNGAKNKTYLKVTGDGKVSAEIFNSGSVEWNRNFIYSNGYETLYFNIKQDGTEFKNVSIYNGKYEPIATFFGSSKLSQFFGDVKAPSFTENNVLLSDKYLQKNIKTWASKLDTDPEGTLYYE